MSRKLVAYFSASGVTAKLAETPAEKLGGLDLEKQHKVEAVLNCLIENI